MALNALYGSKKFERLNLKQKKHGTNNRHQPIRNRYRS